MTSKTKQMLRGRGDGCKCSGGNPAKRACNQPWHAPSKKIESSPLPGFSLIALSQIQQQTIVHAASLTYIFLGSTLPRTVTVSSRGAIGWLFFDFGGSDDEMETACCPPVEGEGTVESSLSYKRLASLVVETTMTTTTVYAVYSVVRFKLVKTSSRERSITWEHVPCSKEPTAEQEALRNSRQNSQISITENFCP